MDKIRRMKANGVSDEDIFSIYTEYVKKDIEKDLRSIYKEEARFLDSGEPWIFRLENK